jgi:hypothetical protein
MVGVWGLAVVGWLLALLDSATALARQATPPRPGRARALPPPLPLPPSSVRALERLPPPPASNAPLRRGAAQQHGLAPWPARGLGRACGDCGAMEAVVW